MNLKRISGPELDDLTHQAAADAVVAIIAKIGEFRAESRFTFGGLSAKPVVNADPGNVPFAVSFDAGGHLAVAEAGANAIATFTLHRDGTVTLVDRAATGQAASPDGQYLYAQAGAMGIVDEYRVSPGGSLTAIGSVTVPGAVGGEGIAAS